MAEKSFHPALSAEVPQFHRPPQLIDGKAVFSATDLVGFLPCDHLMALELAGAPRLVHRPVRPDPQLDLIQREASSTKSAVLLTSSPPTATYPEPVEHCDVCRWSEICTAARWQWTVSAAGQYTSTMRFPSAETTMGTASAPIEDLTADQRAWLLHSEALWRQAHAIVSRQPSLDASDVYHALRNLELPPAERLRRGVTRVRIRSHAR